MNNPSVTGKGPSEIERMKSAMDALRSAPPERAISAMPVIVEYIAVVGRVDHYKRGEEHYFNITRSRQDGEPGEEWVEQLLNAHEIRREFLAIDADDWSGAYDFLSITGRFSPLGDTVTWSEFKQWQDFARLILEHKQLALAMEDGHRSGELAEVLKAISGDYATSFFSSSERKISKEQLDQLESDIRRHPEIALTIQENQRKQGLARRELWTWFRRPPGAACSIEWFPKEKEDADAVLPKLQRGGAMIEFLLPRKALRPAFVIHPSTSLQAIAAAIFADFSNGVEYRTCDFCNSLFAVGNQKGKRFCNQAGCKNAAHSRKVRKKKREQRSDPKVTGRRSQSGSKVQDAKGEK